MKYNRLRGFEILKAERVKYRLRSSPLMHKMVPAFHFIWGISYSKSYGYLLIGFGLMYVEQFRVDVTADTVVAV